MCAQHVRGRDERRSRRDFIRDYLNVGLGDSAGNPSLLPSPATNMLLLSRATMGYRKADLLELQAMGEQDWIEWQLDDSDQDDVQVEAQLAALTTLSLSGQQLHSQYLYNGAVPGHQLRAAALIRAVDSKRQLFERMVGFWTDHFNIDLNAGAAGFLKLIDDREVIRPHALGKFPELLNASAKSGAMLSYLDNESNVAGGPNENYARELMELHTLGVDGPYTESDVRELARCFTGWSFKPPSTGNYGDFEFNAANHDNAAKTVLGQSIPAGGGITDGEMMLNYLAMHPKTAEFIATKLLRWFLTYTPPPTAVAKVKGIYLESGGDIKAMLRWILNPSGLELAAPKLKRPFHLVTSLLRATNAPIVDAVQAIWNVEGLGQTPFDWPAPNGYPDAAGPWAANLIPRWGFVANFCNGWWSPSSLAVTDLHTLIGQAPRSQWGQSIFDVLNHGQATSLEIAQVQAFVDGFQWPSSLDLGQAFELAAASPSFQVY